LKLADYLETRILKTQNRPVLRFFFIYPKLLVLGKIKELHNTGLFPMGRANKLGTLVGTFGRTKQQNH
jgi:hypothetical protein